MKSLRSNRFSAAVVLVALAASASPAMPSGSGSSSQPRESTGSPGQAETSQYEKGMDLVKAEQYAEARKIFEQLEVQQPKNPEVLNMLAYTQRKTGDIDAALENYKRALSIKPKFPEAREYLAEAYLQAALREASTLRGYGGSGEDELETLVNAFQEAATTAEGKGGPGGGKGEKKGNW
jgi:predicted Zn-dependent protease